MVLLLEIYIPPNVLRQNDLPAGVVLAMKAYDPAYDCISLTVIFRNVIGMHIVGILHFVKSNDYCLT